MAVDNAVVKSDLDVVQRTVLDETHPRFQLLSHPMVASPETDSASYKRRHYSVLGILFEVLCRPLGKFRRTRQKAR